MKKLLAYLLTGAMILSMTACGQSADVEETVATDVTNEGGLTIEAGKLLVGMEIGYPPMEYFDEDATTPIGFDVEVAGAVAEELGLELEIIDTAWDGIFAGVDTDKYDCIISSVSITDEREENFILTKPYVANKLVLICPLDSDIASIEDLEGKSVAVQAETTADDYLEERVAGGLNTELFQYDKILNCFDELKAGRTDSVYVDSVVAAYYLGDDINNYKTAWENEEFEPMALCLKKGNDELAAEIDAAVDALYENGKMAEIATKYFGSDITEGLR